MTVRIALANDVDDHVPGPEAWGWLRQLIAGWLALVLSEKPDDFALRHPLAQLLAVPAVADSHGG